MTFSGLWLCVGLMAAETNGAPGVQLRRLVIEAVRKGAEPMVYVDLFGRRLRGRTKSADGEGLEVSILGQDTSLTWAKLGDEGLLKLARTCADMDDAKQVLLLARFAVEKKLRRAEDLLDRLRRLDPEAAKELAPKEAVVAPPPRAPEATAPKQTGPKRRGPEAAFAPKVHGWEPLGLSGGGGMFAPAVSPADPDVMMINCDMSGAYISTDGGRFWKMIHHLQLRSNTRCRPAFHPTDSKTVYAARGARLMVSRDQGGQWEGLGNLGARAFGEIAIDADNPAFMLAGTQNGASVSSDGGKSWKRCDGPAGPAIAFHFERTSPVGRRVVFAATARGVWRSDDGGETWVEKTNGLPWKKVHSFAGGSNPEKGPAMLYCSVESRAVDGKFKGGIFRSRDRGESWESAMGSGINKDTKKTGQWAHGSIAQYMQLLATDARPLTVYATNTSTGFHPPQHDTVYRSDDGGRTWRDTYFMDPRFSRYNLAPNYVTASTGQCYKGGGAPFGVAICATDPERVILVRGQCHVTHDGGRTWFNGHTFPAPGQTPRPGSAWVCNGLVVTTTWHYYVDPFQRNRHYIAYTDIGMARSLDGAKSWIWWEKAKWAPWRNTCYELAFDPDIPGKAWGAFSNVHDIPNGNVIHNRHWAGNPERGPGGVCLSTDFCESWKPLKGGLPVSPVTSIVLDPASPNGSRTLYAAVFGKGVFKSTDDGKTWTKKSKGLGAPSNIRLYRIILHKDGALFALITARKVGSTFRKEGVGLYRSKDGAESWECITRDPVLLWPKDFDVHPGNSSIIFIGAANARGGGEDQGGLWRTKDGGVLWTRVARKGSQHFGAYFHPKRPDWVYMTLCEGAPGPSLHLSTDGGDTWKPFQSFPFSNTQRVRVDPDDDDVIYVTTFGGSVFKGPARP